MNVQITEFVPDINTIKQMFTLLSSPSPEPLPNPQLNEWLRIVRKYNLSRVVLSWLDPITNGLPSISHFIITYKQILNKITDPLDRQIFSKIDIIPHIVAKQQIKLNYPLQVPQYNLFH